MDEAIFCLCSWIKRISVNCPVITLIEREKKGRFISDYLESRNQVKAGATSHYLLPF